MHANNQLGKELGIKRVVLINDFVALGYGLLTVDRKNTKEVRVLQVGEGQKVTTPRPLRPFTM